LIYHAMGDGKLAEHQSLKKLLYVMTVQQGKKYSDPKSKHEIQPFISYHNLDVDEMREPLTSFQNFNEFFYRKLKLSSRPVAAPDDPNILVSPADCRMMVFPLVDDATKIWIKGKHFTLATMIQDEKLAEGYHGGSLAICRLAPQDYHRFHFPVTGVVGSSKHIDGCLFTVNPMAIRGHVDVFTENKRVVTLIETQKTKMVYVTVGATMVGSINFTSKEGQLIQKGDEHGYFAFGGSTVILLFPPKCIEFDADLIENSKKALESLVKMGTAVGKFL